MNAASLINQTSLETEWYTPSFIIEAARKAMGSIDLDPASSVEANKIVNATHIFTKEQDGLRQSWTQKTVWLNHPFGRQSNERWVSKILIESDLFEQACMITYACTSEKWFTPLLRRPQAFLVPRTNYLLPDGTVKTGVTKGSVVTYFGQHVGKFEEAFRNLGIIKLPYPAKAYSFA